MSTFYMARDRTTKEIVGLKILDAKKTAAFEARFVGIKKPKEGEIAIALVHPHIVKTIEHGMTTDDEQFIVMEFLDGPGLNSLIVGRSELLDGRRMKLIRQAAEALAAVHRAGYIHRDICPRNFVVDKELRIAQADRLRPDRAGHAAVHAAGQSHRHGQLHGARGGAAPPDEPEARHLFVWRHGVRAVRVRIALAARRGAGGDGTRLARPDRHSQVSAPRSIRGWKRAIHACLESDAAKRPATWRLS